MEKDEIEKTLRDALELYNSGKYSDASKLWKDILAVDPSNKQAQEGVKMADLLSQQWLDGEGVEVEFLRAMNRDAAASAPEKEIKPIPQTPDPMSHHGSLPQKTPQPSDGAQVEVQKEEERFEIAETVPGSESSASSQKAPPPQISSESKAEMLIAEGEQLVQSKRYSDAIDRFSRAMVLDETNYRIQNLLSVARDLLDKEQQEFERQLHSAIELFDKGDFNASEKMFKEIIAVNPNHNDALFYLEKLRKAKEELGKISSIALDKRDAKGQAEKGKKGNGSEQILEEEIKLATSSSRRAAALTETSQPMKARKKPLATRIILIAAPLVFIVAGFYLGKYVIHRFSAGKQQKVATAALASDIGGNPGTSEGGGAVKKDAEAQISSLNNRLQEVVDRSAQPKMSVPPKPSIGTVDVSRLILDGKNLLKAGRSVDAEKKFKEAMILDPANIEAKQLFEETSKLADEERKYFDRKNIAIKSFNDGDFTEALRVFYRLPDKKKEPIINRYILNSWYNLGVSYLQAGSILEAKNAFSEALSIDPTDSGAKRERDMADWYVNHKMDNAFVGHVENLKFRKLDY